MQLIRVHQYPKANARALPDKYTYNQIRESEQFLRYALYPKWQHPDYPVSSDNPHPLTKWASHSYKNWLDAYELTRACHNEWQIRYGHPPEKIHKSWGRLLAMKSAAKEHLPPSPATLQPCAFDDAFKVHLEPSTLEHVIENYRNYYAMEKRHKEWFKFEKAEPPKFIQPYI